jgi:Zn finger protein HypA/HybF involved in hydrogenase expression
MVIEKIEWIKCTCEKCHYTWIPKTENPIMCPKCKNIRFNEPKEEKKE